MRPPREMTQDDLIARVHELEWQLEQERVYARWLAAENEKLQEIEKEHQ